MCEKGERRSLFMQLLMASHNSPGRFWVRLGQTHLQNSSSTCSGVGGGDPVTFNPG